MITTGPNAWSQRLRYDRQRNEVVLRDSNIPISTVLAEFAKGRDAVREFIYSVEDVGFPDVDAAVRYRTLETTEPGENHAELLELDDEAASCEFAKQFDAEVKRFRSGRLPVVSAASEVCVNLHYELCDLIPLCVQTSPRPSVLLDTFLRIAARCQIAIEDLRLIERSKDDVSCPF